MMSGEKSLQEHFDYVVSNLLKQGEKSKMPKYDCTCAYRGENGRKCAAGWLIPDDQYGQEIEFYKIKDALRIRPSILPSSLCEGIGLDLVMSLQAVHDGLEPHLWRKAFANVAEEYNLSDAVCKEPA